MLSSIVLAQKPIYMQINESWQFKQARLDNWYPATVPGVVHTDLVKNKLIKDPFFELNERTMQWIDKEDWIYETNFDVSSEIFEKNNISIFFKGLDTYADVYLNEEKILAADNMFREWKVDVKKLLKQKDNKLRIYFYSPIKKRCPNGRPVRSLILHLTINRKTAECSMRKSVFIPVRPDIITDGTGGHGWLLPVSGNRLYWKHGMM